MDPGSFCVFNAQICILLHSRDFLSFLTSSSTPITDENSILHCTLINIRYFCDNTQFGFAFFLYRSSIKSLSFFNYLT